MEVTPTLDDAEALRQLMLADEHLMICLCGVDEEHDEDARALQEAVQKIVRIKKQMGGNHQISLARVQGSRLIVEQEFTKDVDTLVAAVPGLLTSAVCDSMVDLDALLAEAARYFGAQREMERQATSSFRLLLVYRQVKKCLSYRVRRCTPARVKSPRRLSKTLFVIWTSSTGIKTSPLRQLRTCSTSSALTTTRTYLPSFTS
ncbi:hypothetical protein, variant 4 [Phytophthora nicotianae]|uniref:Uncharacterized protein n=6 Tax=Phytophthora nicotianae TaxID=4792 RepID=W2RIE2_PHYN3|nr:hypothetical protein, variant 3 [Phytophthora nicotianae INRA-310]XP_008890489.1 hypothetical protein, variant 4 [Phytophthora nicotianae INRA-310]ETM02909.1 hypothetical protein, variant 3 [Phytophthora nicotianae]ETO85398.1 hypothetical protein, variant 3 [Phytophthora nicotianae P1976]ETM02910.1 hypothetical protein, variant 4 [Phytophthora nicotianae]ETN24423.1 hypothetical protein, variant 3 [Phytophthora nicotianae INRA-310]ETN24424.1 hypothetical protein, variant 4 [Phytophthora nic